jgi:4-hydroxybenzoate polyprenyltransferase
MSADVAVKSRAGLGDVAALLRPTQWIKNVVVFAAPAASLKLFSPESVYQALAAFVAFCLAASATYCMNDTLDRRADALHPIKKDRPIARGAISPATAVALALLLLAGSIGLTLVALPGGVTAVIATYFVMQILYSSALKKRIILDVIIIATGFVLRAWAGSLAVGVPASEWLIACMFTLCLFMGFGKRRCEVAMMASAEDARQHRKVLVRYTPDLLTHLITVSAGIAIITFLLYTLDTNIKAPFHKEHLFYTLPIVVYGVFRFAMLTEVGLYTGPTEIVLRDRAMLLAIVLWAVAAMVVAYQNVLFGAGGIPGLLDGIGTQVA